MEEVFGNILDDDEKIIKIFKPQKAKFFWSVLLKWFLFTLFFVLCCILPIVLPNEEEVVISKWYLFVPLGVLVLVMFVIWIFAAIYYKNLFYAYSNKRVIVRSGIFGVDFKSLDMSMIGAVNVYVSFLDKVLKKNTGSITFGSMASPINQASATTYKFNHVLSPYETCKEIKSYIDSYKKEIKK